MEHRHIRRTIGAILFILIGIMPNANWSYAKTTIQTPVPEWGIPTPTPTGLPTSEPTLTPTPIPTPTPSPIVPEKVNLYEATATQYDEIILRWEAIPDADGYAVYRSTSMDGEFETIANLWNGETEYVDKPLPYATTYYYKVCAYYYDFGTFQYGEPSDPMWATTRLPDVLLEAVTTIDHQSLRIKWQTIEGVRDYEVYRSLSESGEYVRVASVTDASEYVDAKLSIGTSYYYKVTASLDVSGSVITSTSGVQSGKPLLAPVKITSVKMTRYDRVEIKWERNKYADGYVVCRTTNPNGRYKKIQTISKNKLTKCTVKKLVNGVLYYYKIFAYKKVDGSSLLGVEPRVKSKRMTYFGYQDEDWPHKQKRIFRNNEQYRYTKQKEAAKNMKTITIRTWSLGTGGKKYTKVRYLTVHKRIAPTVKRIFDEIYKGKEKFPIKDIGGYSWRGNNSTSEHCTGLAIDINPNENYMIQGKKILSGSFWRPNKNPYSIKKDGDVVKAMEKYGFLWGMWGERRDYMHFSYFGT